MLGTKGIVTTTMALLLHALLWHRPIMVSGLAAAGMPPLVSSNPTEAGTALAKKAMTFIDNSPDPFHLVQTSVTMLEAAGFEELQDDVPYSGKVKPGGKYYFTRNKSTIVAFAVGDKYQPGNGFKVIGGHTDSPNLKVKPRSKRSSAGTKCIQLAVECYGGGLWHTWFDRDLGISGRVLVRNTKYSNDDDDDDDDDERKKGGGYSTIDTKLIKIDRAIVRVPNLAIHLTTAKEREAFAFNKEDHLQPILALAAKKALSGESEKEDDTRSTDNNNNDNEKETSVDAEWADYQEPLLIRLLASELNVDEKDICDFELNLFDVQKAALGGVHSEFVHTARLDNLATCFLAVTALVEHTQGDGGNNSNSNLANDEDVSLIALFDHEEVGSASSEGAGSPVMGEAVDRIATALLNQHHHQQQENNNKEDVNHHQNNMADLIGATKARSFVLSVDMGHAVHPNYASKHEKGHTPKMNDGMIIKRNSNQRYATNTMTSFVMREIARKAGLPPMQDFVVRNDCGCGSTIGPIISTATGIRAVDLGLPQLSMHSIRETMGVCDFMNGLQLFNAFFKSFREVDATIKL